MALYSDVIEEDKKTVQNKMKLPNVSPSPNIVRGNDNKKDANGYRSTHATTEKRAHSRNLKRWRKKHAQSCSVHVMKAYKCSHS